jgi:nuclear cap-binding protein subunit 1
LLDIIEIFEVNRKECARLLIEYPKWTVEGTFRPRPGDPAEASERIPIPGRDWQLESALIEVSFRFVFACIVDDFVNWHLGEPDNSLLAVPSA